MTVFKLGNSTYLDAPYTFRNNENTNWACPLDCPTIFVAKGSGIKSGNWQSCTAINTAKFVIEHYLNNDIYSFMPNLSDEDKKEFWDLAVQIESLNNWDSLDELKPLVLRANEILHKLNTL